jgi:hypothetical protein
LNFQIETYAYHLPHAGLANLVDIFISLSVLDDSLYSLCHLDDFKFLADMIEHIKLPLKAKSVFSGSSSLGWTRTQGCQIFLGTTYQNGEKYTNLPAIYKMAVK